MSRAVISIADLRIQAKSRLPRVVFDYLEGGVEDELALDTNSRAFAQQQLVPRRMMDVASTNQSATVFGRAYDSPIGIAPMGSAGFFNQGADLMFAKAAVAANVPFLISSLSTSSFEDAAKIAPQQLWLQLYAARDPEVLKGFIERAHAAGIETLVLTVDVPGHAKRERDIRNGFTLPRRLHPTAVIEALTHPGWVRQYLASGGVPMFENWRPYAEEGADAKTVAKFVASQIPRPVTWSDLELIRSLWPGNLVVKGILRADDARRVLQYGAQGIIVSNHGGRQVDRAPASIHVLPQIMDAVGAELTVMLDSGIRRGSDIMTSLCMGARFVFAGRPFLYGASASGLAGVEKALHILKEELRIAMIQCGCPDVKAMSSDLLYSHSDGPSGTWPGRPGLEA